MTLLIFYLSLALVVSFICSIMEAVLLSTPQSFLVVKQKAGHRWAGQFIALKSNVDKPLSAILTLNTAAHTVGAAGVGAQTIEVFGEAYFGIASVILTILILVGTEVIPKTIGARYWRNLSAISAQTIRGMIFITYPIVLLLNAFTRSFAKQHTEQTTSREEISAIASIGADEGVFIEKEYKIIHNLLKLKNVKVSEIMTPRVVVAVAEENLLLADFLRNKDFLKFSRIPVYSEDPENITGYVFRQMVFEKLAEDQHHLTLKDIKRDIVIVPNTLVLFSVWETLLEKKEHIALIIDEYGGMDGVVTMEDIIETLLGLEIVDETDLVTDMQKLARDRWKTRQAKYNFIDNLHRENE